MKAAVISLGSVSSKWLVESMRKYFKVVDALDLKKIEISVGKKEPVVLYDGKSIGEYDCIYAKGSFRLKIYRFGGNNTGPLGFLCFIR